VSPLHLACWFGKRGIVEMLVEAGADLDAVDEQGKKAADFASDGFKHGQTEAKKCEKIVRKAMGEEVDGKKKKKKKSSKSEKEKANVGVAVPVVQQPAKKSGLSRME